MRRPPRRRRNELLASGCVVGMLARGVGLTVGVLALYLGTLDTGEDRARGLAIATLVMGQVFLVLAELAGERPIWRAASGGNRALVWILAATIGSLVLAGYLPFIAELLHVVAPSPLGWIVAAAVAAAGILPAEVLKRIQRRSLRSST